MEKLKSLIPDELKRIIAESTPESLTSSCSSLLDFFRALPEFQRVIGELTDPELALCRKNKETASDFKRRGNEHFSKRDYAKALSFYSQALRFAPMEADEMGKNLVATLYVNRASSMHNIGLLEDCLRDCNRAISIMPVYAKAWYRKGKANASLKNYGTAICDLKAALSMEHSSSGKGQINNELEMAQRHFSCKDGTDSLCSIVKHKKLETSVELPNIRLKCVSTTSKGRGMTSADDVPPAALVHCEEPLSAIVSKSCRETHCHFCFNEVPADVLYCPSCTIPVYCSQHCQEQAIGEYSKGKQNDCTSWENLPGDLGKHIKHYLSINVVNSAGQDIYFDSVPEHKHECGGAHWPVVLPPDVILAGRIMVKAIEKRRLLGETSKPIENLVLAHNYLQEPTKGKLELHIYAVVLSYCLEHYYNSDYPSTAVSVSQLVILISQVKVNSMAVVHMKSFDGYGAFKKLSMCSGSENTFSVQQVRVGQALYSTGSFFNHSCQPNIHAYFMSRKLFLRATEHVCAGYPLEISYGPQVGQWDLLDRQELLKEQYSFKCQCTGCSELNVSDLVLNAFRCVKDNCSGVVTENAHFDNLEDDTLQISDAYSSCKLTLPVHRLDISKIAYLLVKGPVVMRHIMPGFCLSCGFELHLPSVSASSRNAMLDIQRLKDCLDSNEYHNISILDFLESLNGLRSLRHPYSRFVAQAEDIIAEACVRSGELEPALQHCQSSIGILEKLFHRRHIVIGNELIKLGTIQLSLGDHAAALCSIRRVEEIFSLYYGTHVADVCPYVVSLQKEVDDLSQKMHKTSVY